MENDTDSFIIAQLVQQNFIDGEKITNLSMISAQIFKEIILFFFQKMGVDISQMQSTSVLQKFKIAGQILELLNVLQLFDFLISFHQKKFNIQCELTTLMNPNPADLRRTLVVMLQKSIVKEEESQPQAQILTLDEKIKLVAEQQQQEILNKWLNEDWILPQLNSKRQTAYRSFETNIHNLTSKNMKHYLLADCLEGLDKKSLLLLHTLTRKIQGLKIQRHLERDQYSEEDADKYNLFLMNKIKEKRRVWKEAVKVREEKLKENKENEFEGWSGEIMLDAGRRTLPRKVAQNESQQNQIVVDSNEWEEYQKEERGEQLRMYRIQEEAEEEEQEEEKVELTQNMFNLEINYGQEVVEENEALGLREERVKGGKVIEVDQNIVHDGEEGQREIIKEEQRDIDEEDGGEQREERMPGQKELINQTEIEEKQLTEEQLKRRNLQKIEAMQQELQLRREAMQNSMDERTEVEKKLKELESRVIERKRVLQEKEQQVDVEQVRLTHLLDEQAQQQLQEANKRQEVEVAKMEREWQDHKQEVMQKLSEFKEQVQAKTERYDKLKLKAKTIDEETQKLVNDIRNNEIVLKEINEEFEKIPKVFNRTGYVERIKNISNNLSKQKNKFGMITNEIKDIKNMIAYTEQNIANCFSDIENKFKVDSKKHDNLNKQIISMYQQYKDLCQKTKEALEEKGRQKQINRQNEMKIELLEMKNYQKNLEKMQQDLAQIKAENEKLDKSLVGK